MEIEKDLLLNDGQANELLEYLTNEAQNLIGDVMVYSLVNVANDWLIEHNIKPAVLLYNI